MLPLHRVRTFLKHLQPTHAFDVTVRPFPSGLFPNGRSDLLLYVLRCVEKTDFVLRVIDGTSDHLACAGFRSCVKHLAGGVECAKNRTS